MPGSTEPSGAVPQQGIGSAAQPAPFIRMRNLRKTFGSGPEAFVAVSDVTLDVPLGGFLSLVGPSGCGKTTLLKILAGLYSQDDGTIEIGVDGTPFEAGRDVGMVFQAPLLLKWRRIIDNVMLPAEIIGLPRAATRERARDLLALVGLAGFEDKYPYELSGGMQQRAAIARALVHDPKLVLMDEPFGALDALTRDRLNLELHRIWRESGKTIVFVTHGISEAVLLGTQVAVLTTRPARMAALFQVELESPRTLLTRTEPRFATLTREIYQLLEDA